MGDRMETGGSLEKSSKRSHYEIIVIGASTGGFDALSIILPRVPRELKIPIVIVLHIPSDGANLLAELFSSKVALHVKDAADGEAILPGTIYFAPANFHLSIDKDRSLLLSEGARVNFSRPSIDVLFKSAAEVFGKGVLGILLTGANEDGADGLRHIQAAGGTAIVQDPATASAPVMPDAGLNAIAAGPTQILSIDEISVLLISLRDVLAAKEECHVNNN